MAPFSLWRDSSTSAATSYPSHTSTRRMSSWASSVSRARALTRAAPARQLAASATPPRDKARPGPAARRRASSTSASSRPGAPALHRCCALRRYFHGPNVALSGARRAPAAKAWTGPAQTLRSAPAPARKLGKVALDALDPPLQIGLVGAARRLGQSLEQRQRFFRPRPGGKPRGQNPAAILLASPRLRAPLGARASVAESGATRASSLSCRAISRHASRSSCSKASLRAATARPPTACAPPDPARSPLPTPSAQRRAAPPTRALVAVALDQLLLERLGVGHSLASLRKRLDQRVGLPTRLRSVRQRHAQIERLALGLGSQLLRLAAWHRARRALGPAGPACTPCLAAQRSNWCRSHVASRSCSARSLPQPSTSSSACASSPSKRSSTSTGNSASRSRAHRSRLRTRKQHTSTLARASAARARRSPTLGKTLKFGATTTASGPVR